MTDLEKQGLIEPLSFNDFQERYSGGVEKFTIYSLGYWLQQNADKSGEQYYEKLKGDYDRHDKSFITD